MIHTSTTPGEQARNQKIGTWLAKLGSYLAHEGLSENWTPETRAEFFAELVRDVIAEGLPDAAWSTDGMRFVRRRCEFFPSLKRLCDLLQEFSAPIVAAHRQHQDNSRKHLAFESGRPGLTRADEAALSHYRAHCADGFKQLALDRETNVFEAEKSQVGILKRYFPKAFETLFETEKAAR